MLYVIIYSVWPSTVLNVSMSDKVAEWLRQWTANEWSYVRVGLIPIVVN